MGKMVITLASGERRTIDVPAQWGARKYSAQEAALLGHVAAQHPRLKQYLRTQRGKAVAKSAFVAGVRTGVQGGAWLGKGVLGFGREVLRELRKPVKRTRGRK